MSNSRYMVVRNNDVEFPVFQKPVIIGYYSLDTERQYYHDARNIKYLRKMNTNQVKFNLNLGFKEASKVLTSNSEGDGINSILMWLCEQKVHKNLLDIRNGRSTFVCFRGLLSSVMATPYERDQDWIVCARKIKDVIYLCAYDTEEKKQKNQNATEREKRFQYWGYKFEQFMMTKNPTMVPDTNAELSGEQFCMVFRTRLGEHYLIYAAEMDGVDTQNIINKECSPSELNRFKFVELKTSRHVENERQDRNFRRFKLLKWWCQSFLVGIEDIICGFRDDVGIVHELQNLKTRNMPKISQAEWKGNVCMNYLEQLLSFVKVIMDDEPEESLWKFHWKPEFTVTAEKIDLNSEFNFIPTWFLTKHL